MSYTDADLRSVQNKVAGLDLTDAETEALARLLDEAINGDVVGFRALCDNELIGLMSVEDHFTGGVVTPQTFPGAMAGALRDLSSSFGPPRQP